MIDLPVKCIISCSLILTFMQDAVDVCKYMRIHHACAIMVQIVPFVVTAKLVCFHTDERGKTSI